MKEEINEGKCYCSDYNPKCDNCKKESLSSKIISGKGYVNKQDLGGHIEVLLPSDVKLAVARLKDRISYGSIAAHDRWLLELVDEIFGEKLI